MTNHLPRKNLGRTGIPVSRLAITGSFGLEADDVERAFHEFGINHFFVTARMKDMIAGIRRLIAAGHRDDMVIQAGTMIPTGGSVHRTWRRMAKRLGVDTIDIFQVFWVQYNWFVTGRTWVEMRRLKEDGKARALGISCHDRKFARRLVDDLDLDALMIRYNAAHRGAEEEIFASLSDDEHRPGIIAYTATRWKRLLKPVADLGPMTPAECYRFQLGHPSVDVSLCGAGSWQELEENVRGVMAGPLGDERLAEIRTFGDAVRKSATGRIGF